MAKELTDEEQTLRRKARRRLIGAIALTLAVVVILPMVLDSEPRPAVQDIELRIPAPDKVGEFVPGVPASEVAETAPLTATEPAPAAASAVTQAVPPPVAAPATNIPKAETPGKTQKPLEAKTAEPMGEAKVPGDESFVAQTGAYTNPDTAKQELDRLKKLGFRKAYTEKAGGMVRVRIGPYAEREKAEEVRQMLEKHGLHPVVTSVK